MNSEMNEWKARLKTPVVVLFGGDSAERDVSLQSGAAVLAALRSAGIAAEGLDTAEPLWLNKVAGRYAHAFIALHGLHGEDGTVQGALQTLGITHTGSGVLASALALDKLRTKQLWNGIGLPTPAFEVLTAATDWAAVIARLGAVMVKPVHEGSSIGMARASTAAELADAYAAAARYDACVLAEQWITGAEYTVAILGERALPAIRLQTDNLFYDYQAKYLSDDTRYHCPCGLSAADEQRMQELALQAFRSVGGTGWGRVDFLTDQQGAMYLLEVNTVPGMTSHSLVPMAAKAAGLDFETLVAEILRLSLLG